MIFFDNMRHCKIITVTLVVFFLLFTACVSTGSGTGLSLMEAIEQTAEKIAGELPKGSRVAIVAFESSNANLSDYIMEELTGALFDRGIEVADRQNLEYVYKELNLQMSGDVSDESAKSIGKFLGASTVITGQLLDISGAYRYRASAISVEEAVRASVTRLNVKKDDEMRKLITALSNKKVDKKKSKYGISENTVPKTAGEFLDRGVIFAERSDFEMAITDFNEALKLNPNLSAAYVLRGRALVASAVRVNIVNLKDNFSGIEAFSMGGRDFTDKQKKNLEQALTDYTQALRLDPNNAVIYKERGDVYSHLGEPDKAISDFNQALRLNPNYSAAYSGRSNAYANKSEEDRAIADINQAIRLNPNDAFLYRIRAHYYYVSYENNKGDIDRIIADYTKAIQLDPNNADLYSLRGFLYRYIDFDKAIADLTKAIQLDPDYAYPYIYYYRAIVYEAKGNFDKAIDDYTKWIQLVPKNAYAYSSRGDVYRNKGDFDKAILDYTQAISLDDSKERYFTTRGDIYKDKGDFDKAIADYTQAIKLTTFDFFRTSYIARRGYLYIDKGNFDLAIADFTQLIRLNPNNAVVLHDRGIAYWWKNDLNNAIADIEAALRIEPNNANYRKNLEEVKRQRGW
jgi:tetratricopeptide (TPR) repeat protein